jgi:hypothetical protein
LSYRDVEDLLAERGLEISNETIRRWALKFAPVVARNLTRMRPILHAQWHLDEMVVSIARRRMYMCFFRNHSSTDGGNSNPVSRSIGRKLLIQRAPVIVAWRMPRF